jgi:hypothetical protein
MCVCWVCVERERETEREGGGEGEGEEGIPNPRSCQSVCEREHANIDEDAGDAAACRPEHAAAAVPTSILYRS